jgi:hypothetical protein
MFELILADFAKNVGAGLTKRIVLQLDNAGWHGPENLKVPDCEIASNDEPCQKMIKTIDFDRISPS